MGDEKQVAVRPVAVPVGRAATWQYRRQHDPVREVATCVRADRRQTRVGGLHFARRMVIPMGEAIPATSDSGRFRPTMVQAA